MERLQEQSLSSFKAAHLMTKVDSLDKEVTSLKVYNTELKESVELLNTKLDTRTATTTDVLFNQQHMLSAMMHHMGLPLPTDTPSIKPPASTSNPKPRAKAKSLKSSQANHPHKHNCQANHLNQLSQSISPYQLSIYITTTSGQKQEITTTVVPETMPTTQPSLSSRVEDAKPVEVSVVTEAKLQEVANSDIYHDR